jgi:hypothetical protein
MLQISAVVAPFMFTHGRFDGSNTFLSFMKQIVA